MIAPRWIKLWRDAVAARGRLVLIVGAVAASVAALATMAITSAVLTREVPRSYLGSNPASAQLELVAEPDAALLARVRQRADIAQVEPAASLRGRIELSPGDWASLLLFVVPDFETQAINTVHPEASVAPAGQEQTVYGYVTPRTLAVLGETVSLTLLKVVVTRDRGDVAAIERTARDLAGWLATQGNTVEQIRIPPPRQHPHQAQMNAILATLTGFSGLALVLGAVLCATVISALLAQQVRQIGIMKAIGARTSQVALPLLVLVALLGLLGTAIGLPLGLFAADVFVRAIAQLLNLRLEDATPPGALLGLLMLPGILLPLFVTLWPVAAAARRSVRTALDDHGGDSELSAVARLAARMSLGDIASTLALRNSLRRRTRLLLTLALLGSAGAMLATSLALRSAWTDTVAGAGQQRRWDIEIGLQAPEPTARVVDLVRALPAVRAVEPWNGAGAAAAGSDGVEVVKTYPDGGHGGFGLRAAPPDTAMILPHLVEGRWLLAGDSDAVVLNTSARTVAFRNAHAGDTVMLTVGHRPLALHLVGVIDETLMPGAAYVTPAMFDLTVGTPDARDLGICRETPYAYLRKPAPPAARSARATAKRAK